MSTTLARLESTTPYPAGAEEAGQNRSIVFFDGVCGFCNASINWLLRRDPAGKLAFAPLQGVTATELLPTQDREELHSLVLWTPHGLYRKTSAVVRILWLLGGIWGPLGTLLWLIPRPVRDLGYTLVARNRYRFAGRKEACRIPTPQERPRFLP